MVDSNINFERERKRETERDRERERPNKKRRPVERFLIFSGSIRCSVYNHFRPARSRGLVYSLCSNLIVLFFNQFFTITKLN